MKNLVNSLDDLRLASHKVDEVNKLILEQERKIKQSTSYSHLSFLSYMGVITTSFVMIVFAVVAAAASVVRGTFRVSLSGGKITIPVLL